MNVIPDRVERFLSQHPPFSMLTSKALSNVADSTIIKHLMAGDYIFKEGDFPGQHIYIVREGAVQLIKEGNNTLVEVCDEGDVFGIRPLIVEEAYLLSAKSTEESIIYALDVANLRELIETTPQLGYFLAKHLAADINKKYSKTFIADSPSQVSVVDQAGNIAGIQALIPSKTPVYCSPKLNIKEVARLMKSKRVGSIVIVDKALCPLGIVTNKDMRDHVATGEVSLDAPIDKIMSTPVVCLPPKQSIAEIQIHMMKKRIHHVCITKDGSISTALVGVLSQHDLLLAQGNNPAVLIKAIQRSKDVIALRSFREKAEQLLAQYLAREVSIDFIATIMTEVNDALMSRVIELAIEELEEEGNPLPTTDWCWMGLGSEGRGEQLLRTDQDNALVFADVLEGKLESTRESFLLLAKKVTKQLNTCGFEYCPADMMASNPRWCLSLSEWKQQFAKWILTPTNHNILHCNIFFDYRALYGASYLCDLIGQHIFELIDQQQIFLPLLAKNALQNPPPLSFFRNFVVEKDGQHKDEFNIKARAMMPLTDAARLLVLGNKISKINNTFERFEKLSEVEPKYQELFQQAADAYEILMRYRAMQGLKNKNGGKFFKPGNLSKMERLNLRNCFRPIQELQDIIKVRYQLNFFG